MPTTALLRMAVLATQMAPAHQARLDSAVLGGLNGLGAPAWAGLAPGAFERPIPPRLACSMLSAAGRLLEWFYNCFIILIDSQNSYEFSILLKDLSKLFKKTKRHSPSIPPNMSYIWVACSLCVCVCVLI